MVSALARARPDLAIMTGTWGETQHAQGLTRIAASGSLRSR